MIRHPFCQQALKRVAGMVGVVATLAVLVFAQTAQAQLLRATLSGGPDGSVLEEAGQGLSSLLSRSLESLEVPYTASAGSKENIRRIASGAAVFGVVHGGDLYRELQAASMSALPEHPRATDAYIAHNVTVVASLFGLHAHLLVRNESDLNDLADLVGRVVAVGAAGSSVATAAQHILESLDLWHRIEPQFLPALQSIEALLAKEVDAVWLFDTAPNTLVAQAMTGASLRLLALESKDALSPLTGPHPYYSVATIPAETYPGQSHPISTFQDSVLWVASAAVPEENVFDAITALYSEDGLAFMRSLSDALSGLDRQRGLSGVTTPLHPGAQQYWQSVQPADNGEAR